MCVFLGGAGVGEQGGGRQAGRGKGVVQVLEGERDAVLYYLLARHPGRALVSVSKNTSVWKGGRQGLRSRGGGGGGGAGA
jgi:hypothetical protein